MTALGPRATSLLARLRPYCVVTPYNRPHLDLAPFGATVATEDVIDPLRVDAEIFLDLLARMDALTFGPEGMPMPRWVFYDASELSGGIFGLGLPAAAVDETVRARYRIPSGYDGLVPFSMYIAIPMPDRGAWFGHNLSSLNPTFPHLDLKGLGTVTKALALKAFRAEVQVGATQWDSDALFIHVRFGPLRLQTAWTPAHSESATLTYAVDCTDASLRDAMERPTRPVASAPGDEIVASDDEVAMRALQQRIEAGARLHLPGPPKVRPAAAAGGHPIFEVTVRED